MRLVITADTHVPKRARDLPDPLWAAIDAADVVLHAGDWVDVALLDAVEGRARRLVAVYGNNDGPPLRARLPEVARFPDCDLLVFGHSHIPWDTVAPTGLRLLNPGSPTDRRAQPHATYLTARVTAGRLDRVELHRLPRREGH